MEVYRIVQNEKGKYQVETIPEYKPYLEDKTGFGIFMLDWQAKQYCAFQNRKLKEQNNSKKKHPKKKKISVRQKD